MVIRANALGPVLLALAIVLASCGAPPGTTDWCYTFDLAYGPPDLYNMTSNGQWVENVGLYSLQELEPVEQYVLTLSMTHTAPVNTTMASFTAGRDNPNLGMNVAGNLQVFNLVQDTFAYYIPYGVGLGDMYMTPSGSTGASTDMNVSIAAEDEFFIQAITLWGYGANPFGTSNCDQIIPLETPPGTGEPTATATEDNNPEPSATPTNTPTLTPSPTSTPLACEWEQELNFGASDYGFLRLANSATTGVYVPGVGWREAHATCQMGPCDQLFISKTGLTSGGYTTQITAHYTGAKNNGPGGSNSNLNVCWSSYTCGGANQFLLDGVEHTTTLTFAPNTLQTSSTLYISSSSYTDYGQGHTYSELIVYSLILRGTGINPFTGQTPVCASPTPTPTNTPQPATSTPTASNTAQPSNTPGPTLNRTQTITPIPSATRQPSATRTHVFTITPTRTNTALPGTATPSRTPAPATATRTPFASPTVYGGPTLTASATWTPGGPTATATPSGGGTNDGGDQPAEIDFFSYITGAIGWIVNTIGGFIDWVESLVNYGIGTVANALTVAGNAIALVSEFIGLVGAYINDILTILRLLIELIIMLIELIARWASQMIGIGEGLIVTWYVVPAEAIPGMPQCFSNPTAYDICAVYYVLQYTILGGLLGALIIIVIRVLLALAMIVYFIKTVRNWVLKLQEMQA